MLSSSSAGTISRQLLAVTVALSASATVAAQSDVEGSHDHPLVKRYAGASIQAFADKEHDATLVLADEGHCQKVEGRVYEALYRYPPRSTCPQILRSHEKALRAANAEVRTGTSLPAACNTWDIGGSRVERWVAAVFRRPAGGASYVFIGCADRGRDAPAGPVLVVDAGPDSDPRAGRADFSKTLRVVAARGADGSAPQEPGAASSGSGSSAGSAGVAQGSLTGSSGSGSSAGVGGLTQGTSTGSSGSGSVSGSSVGSGAVGTRGTGSDDTGQGSVPRTGSGSASSGTGAVGNEGVGGQGTRPGTEGSAGSGSGTRPGAVGGDPGASRGTGAGSLGKGHATDVGATACPPPPRRHTVVLSCHAGPRSSCGEADDRSARASLPVGKVFVVEHISALLGTAFPSGSAPARLLLEVSSHVPGRHFLECATSDPALVYPGEPGREPPAGAVHAACSQSTSLNLSGVAAAVLRVPRQAESRPSSVDFSVTLSGYLAD